MSNYVCNECTSEDIKIIKGIGDDGFKSNEVIEILKDLSKGVPEPQALDDYYMSLMEKS